MNTLAESLVALSGWHFAQLTILAAVLLLIEYFFGRRLGSRWCYGLWMLFLVKLFLPPQVALPTSPVYWWPRSFDIEIEAVVESRTSMSANGGYDETGWESAEVAVGVDVVVPPDALPTEELSWQVIAIGVWLGGVIVMGLATHRRKRLSRKILGKSSVAPAGLQSVVDRARSQVGLRFPVELRLVETDSIPLVTGLRRPVVYLPRSLVARLDARQFHAVIVHELYHVKRGDLWVATVQGIARVLFFHYAVVWWVNARISRLREEAVDRAVLSHAEISRQSYSQALVEAAALPLKSASISSFGLGVIETKSQLRKRIEMNLILPRAGRVRLGVPGLISIVVLGFALIPMTPGFPSGQVKPPLSPAFKPIDANSFVERIDETTTHIFDAFNRRDQAAYLAAYAENSIILADGSDLLKGRADVAQMYLRSPARLIYEPMQATDRTIYSLGDIVVEAQLVAFNFRLHPDAPVMTDYRQALTIWQEAPDGTLEVKLLAWNKLHKPEALQHQTAPAAYALKESSGSFAANGDFSAVLEAEERFHQAFQDGQLEGAAEYYADGALLNVPQALPMYGRDRILEYLLDLSPDQLATNIERQVAHIEGNAKYVLVINLFRWDFQPNGAEFTIPVAGKGVHLWERDAEGRWRILFDLPNASQPTN